MKNNIKLIGFSYFIATTLVSLYYMYFYCFEGGFCLSYEGQIIMPWLKELEIWFLSLINPFSFLLAIPIFLIFKYFKFEEYLE